MMMLSAVFVADALLVVEVAVCKLDMSVKVKSVKVVEVLTNLAVKFVELRLG